MSVSGRRLASPLPWRKVTPLHKMLGARSLRFVYTLGDSLPSVASPASLVRQYSSSDGIDRIIGFNLSIGNIATPANFLMTELNTGWQFPYNFKALGGVYILGNVETLTEEAKLQWSFDAALASTVYLTFFNFEVAPIVIA